MELLTTSEAARLLGTSRQHVVNLCDRGRLEHVTVGTHRRIPRVALDAFVLGPPTSAPLRREQELSLWLHSAVAGHLVADPERILGVARRNLARLSRLHPGAEPYLEAWRRAIDQGPNAVLGLLTSPKPNAVELRQNSPFAGVLTEVERQRVIASFRGHAGARIGT
jgi:excisionase family DNA binding protein